MDERWPKGSRGPRGSRAWLVDSRGRQYRLSSIVAFQVYFQPAEGKLWNRLYRDGLPLRLPALISRAEFVDEVGNREGAYQLQPIDAQGHPIGDPPSMIFVPQRPPTGVEAPGALRRGTESRSDGVTGLVPTADEPVVAPESPTVAD